MARGVPSAAARSAARVLYIHRLVGRPAPQAGQPSARARRRRQAPAPTRADGGAAAAAELPPLLPPPPPPAVAWESPTACDCDSSGAHGSGATALHDDPYGPHRPGSHPAAFDPDPAFGVFRSLNAGGAAAREAVGLRRPTRTRLSPPMAPLLLEQQQTNGSRGSGGPAGVVRRLAAELALRSAVDAKELMEAAEFWHRVRRRVRRPVIIDAACGHGLAAIVFAAAEQVVERVLLMDQRRAASLEAVLDAADIAAPWVRAKVEFVEVDLRSPDAAAAAVAERVGAALGGGGPHRDRCGVIAVHACGTLTDAALDLAVDLCAPVAVMPCCYTGTARGTPLGVRRALGVGLAADVGRSYRMQGAGYHVDWAAVPRAITPMNRILVAEPPRGAGGGGDGGGRQTNSIARGGGGGGGNGMQTNPVAPKEQTNPIAP